MLIYILEKKISKVGALWGDHGPPHRQDSSLPAVIFSKVTLLIYLFFFFLIAESVFSSKVWHIVECLIQTSKIMLTSKSSRNEVLESQKTVSPGGDESEKGSLFLDRPAASSTISSYSNISPDDTGVVSFLYMFLPWNLDRYILDRQ